MRPFMKISNPPNPFLPPKYTATISCSPEAEHVLANVATLSFDHETMFMGLEQYDFFPSLFNRLSVS